ncbi:MAG TPA: T9SS type A sorting domain-containing protein [Bacteroidetes bacterium]|nr:T9SS type A sorting domain-containing protein [Bacteroidota bacterium]
MKYTSTIIALLLLMISGNLQAQCTPDPNITDPGIYPTPVAGIAQGTVGTAYSQVLTVNVPMDTTIDLSIFGPGLPTVTASINFQTIDNFNGLPPGLSYTCTPTSCSIIGGNAGCIDITGIPTTTGQYVANLATTVNITIPANIPIIGGTSQNLPVPLAYNIEVTGTVGNTPGFENGFTVGKLSPNPVNSLAKINFYTSALTNVTLEITSLNGQVIHHETIQNVSGDSAVELNVQDYAPGIYFYRLNNGKNSITRRLVVTH